MFFIGCFYTRQSQVCNVPLCHLLYQKNNYVAMHFSLMFGYKALDAFACAKSDVSAYVIIKSVTVSS